MNQYNNSLLIPKTSFPMKANLSVKEIQIQNLWDDYDAYNKLLTSRKDNELFFLHDGPPFANGNIHVGHAFNKILKDFIIRQQLLKGKKIIFITGWDTHGLPIEHVVIKKYGRKILKDKIKFRTICREYALKQVEKQEKDFKRLGIYTNWKEKYLTLLPEYEQSQLEVFASMINKGMINKGKKIVAYSPTSQTALAEAEIEYKVINSPSTYVKFTIIENNTSKELNNINASFIIWTTTPWTLLANTAVCLGADFLYILIKIKNEHFIIAEELLEQLKSKFEWNNIEIIKKYKGKELEGLKCNNPVINRESVVINGDHVALNMGTGAVHTAPAYGEDDFIVGLKYNLPLISVTDKSGKIFIDDERFNGLYYLDANKKIIDVLNDNKKLLLSEEYQHSYPHDWRTKKPVIYWATEQWFINIKKIKEQTLKSIKDIEYKCSWAYTRLYNMIESRDSWCISRQRIWGVPIPIFYTEKGNPIIDSQLVLHVSKLFSEYGSDIWYEWDSSKLLPKNYKHKESPNNIFTKEMDIMDVWFDSGTSYNYISKKYNINLPFDLYLEGNDQYRGWFNSSLITAISHIEKAPYRSLLSAGFVLDADGYKMSKSTGNIISPQDIVNKYGSDVLRLWTCSVDYSADVRISENIINQISDRYRKIRNTLRFILGNISDFSEANIIDYDNLEEIDKYVIQLLNIYTVNINKYYSEYNFTNIYKDTNNFITNILSSFYFDYSKDILYCDKKNSKRRLQIQTTLKIILDSLFQILAPIVPHTIEEGWQCYLNDHNINKKESYFEIQNKKILIIDKDIDLINKWNTIMNIRTDVLKSLENSRKDGQIGKSLDAEIILFLNKDSYKLISTFSNLELNRLFIVSKVNFKINENANETKNIILTNKYKGKMCKRCWNRYEEILFKTDDLCERCFYTLN